MHDQGNAVSVQKEIAASDPSLKWEQLKPALQKEFGETAFKSWIVPATPLSCMNGVLEISVPTRFMRDWIKTHYADTIRRFWSQQFGVLGAVNIKVGAPAAKTSVDAAVLPIAAPANANDSPSLEKTITEKISSPLDSRYTFDHFVVGKSNELAAAAARKIAESDEMLFNPLFIHGGVGLGKTHLMQATAHAIRARAPEKKVLYMSAEKFMYQFVTALRNKDTMSFKDNFRGVDVLMIDDIQFICGKGATQEEFFHTFNALLDQKKQVIITADRAPTALEGLEERLRSRLGGGLVADVQNADVDLRLRVLQKKCEMLKRSVPPEVLEFLAHKITSNIRELEGALNRVVVHAELIGREITIDSVQDILQDILRANSRAVSVEDIQKRVAEHYSIRLSDMHSPRRARMVARPRQVAMYLSKILTQHSLPEIGRKFGGRDHTTIMHGIRKVEELMVGDKSLREEVDLLKRLMAA